MLADEGKSCGGADSVLASGGSSQTKFKILFCDMDGTLMNSRSMITNETANALRAAMKIGVQVIIATGKTRPAALAALETVGLTGRGGALSHTSPGVFLQGLQVYGKEGTILHSQLLDPKVVSETFKFSVEHQVPLVGFSGDKCVTLFSHPLIDTLHEVYYEPKVILFFLFDSVVVNLFFELSSSSFLCFISHLCCKGM
jgi:hydroxymethylpyrimidine pyrophosphatase-like HAD family hydrolase